MARSFARLILPFAVAAAAASGFAQNTAPPLPNSPAAQSAPGPITTLKAGAQLVIVDVVVTDPSKAAVHNLKASDFTVLENGSAQQIKGFEEHITTPAAKAPPMRPLPPGIFTNFTPVPAGSAVNVLLLDALNTPMKDQSYVRDQLLDFLRKTPPGTRVAIFGLNDRLIMLQGFTSDLSVLRSVMEKSIPSPSLMLADSVGNGGTDPVSEQMSALSGIDPNMAQLITSLQQFEAVQASTDSQIRAQATLLAMNQLAHYLAGLPGRKNLIWFSGSFPLDVFPQGDIEHPFATVDNSEDQFRQTTDLLTRSQVAVYPVDARGLQTQLPAIAVTPTVASLRNNGGLAAAKDKAFQDNANEHMTMNRMAADTGGQAYVDTNGLSVATEKAMEHGANYYTISYTPTDNRQNGAFRKIQVKLTRPGVTLAYRSGYFADDSAKQGPSAAAASANQPNPFIKAMLRGAPDATEILLKLQVLPANNAEEKTAVNGNVLSPEPAVKTAVKGPFRRYAIDVAADARDIRVTPTTDGHYQFSVELRTFVYDVGGHVINAAIERGRGNLTASSFANMLHVGLPFHQEISVPVSGEYYIRTSLHDLETDRYGSVEIPVASIANLKPLAAVNSPAQQPAPR